MEGERTPDRGGVPGEVLARSNPKKKIFGLSISSVDKGGSKLDILEGKETVLARNSEIPIKSAIAWEFIALYSNRIFPESVANDLFGVWGCPQVAPVLERRGRARTYYKDKGVTVYSEMVGFDTSSLMRKYDLEGYLTEYNMTEDEGEFVSRTVDSTTYWFIKDVFGGVPEIDPDNYVLERLERYWDEHKRVNSQIQDEDAFSRRDLHWDDYFYDSSFKSSIDMIRQGHAISAKVNEIIDTLDAKGLDKLKWRDKPIRDVLMLMLHLHQTSVQHAILWWFGVQHGHLHFGNTVSREVQGGTPSHLETRIIDFDQARISAAKLKRNTEIYKLVDIEKLRLLMVGSQLSNETKLQVCMYLPLRAWTDVEFDLVKDNVDSPLINELMYLVTSLLSEQGLGEGEYQRFAKLILFVDNVKLINAVGHRFSNTLFLVDKDIDKVENVPEFRVIVNYSRDGLGGIDLDKISETEKLQLLALIYNRKIGHGFDNKLEEDEICWVMTQLYVGGKVGEMALIIFGKLMSSISDNKVLDIFERARKIGGEDLEIVRKMLKEVYSIDHRTLNTITRKYVTGSLSKLGLGIFAIDNIDFGSLPTRDALEQYACVRKSFGELSDDNLKCAHLKQVDRAFIRAKGMPLFLVARMVHSLI